MPTNAANFWSNLTQKPAAAEPPSPEQPASPTPAESSAGRKMGSPLVFRSHAAFGAKGGATTTKATSTPTTPHTATSWADEVEESEAQAAGTSAPLDAISVQQAARLGKLEHDVKDKSHRIEQLEGTIKDKIDCIGALEDSVHVKDLRIVELEAKVHDQEMRIEDLVGQVDKEARRAKELDEELSRKRKLISELELQIAEHISIPGSESPTEVGEPTDEDEPLGEFESQASPTASMSLKGAREDTVEGATQDTPPKAPKIDVIPTAGEDFPALAPSDFPALISPAGKGSPAPRDLTAPVFVTASTLKKVAPVPPPPQLKLGIDTTKFGKKPETGAASKPKSGARRATEAPPGIDTWKDIRRMSKEERAPFGAGPTVQIVMGNETVAALPKYVFMQCSEKAFKHWTENPNAQSMRFEAGSMDQEALNAHVEWMTMHTWCNRVYSVSLKKENSDRHNLEIVRAARVLGLNSMYVAHFTKQYCQRIRDGPSDELVALVEELAYTDNDPIFDCLANNMALHRAKADPKNPGIWDKTLDSLPKLAAKMQEIDGRGRKGAGPGKSPGRGKRSPPPTRKAEEAAATTATAEADPDAAWRATGPSWM